MLSSLSKSQRAVPASIEFVDIAGLVKGASHGEVTALCIIFNDLVKNFCYSFLLLMFDISHVESIVCWHHELTK